MPEHKTRSRRQASTRSTRGGTFKVRQAVPFTFTAVPFEQFQSVGALDFDLLSRARHAVVELGQFKGDCCNRTVRATIRRGQVTAVSVDPCADGEVKLAPDMARFLAAGHRKLVRSMPPGPRLPMPVARFFRRVNDTGPVIVIDLSVVCMHTCVDILGTRVCTVCCITLKGEVFCASFPNLGSA
jgi:hypothetical protein